MYLVHLLEGPARRELSVAAVLMMQYRWEGSIVTVVWLHGRL